MLLLLYCDVHNIKKEEKKMLPKMPKITTKLPGKNEMTIHYITRKQVTVGSDKNSSAGLLYIM